MLRLGDHQQTICRGGYEFKDGLETSAGRRAH